MTDTITVAAAGDLHCAPPLRAHVLRAFEGVRDADLILLAGDLTTHGELEQAEVLVDAVARVEAPVIAVLGNHDYHSGHADEVAALLREAGVTVLCREATVIELRGLEIGIVGTKGFVGGFEGAEIPDFGEPLLRAVYAETTAEADAIERGLEEIAGCHRRIVLLHYAPIRETLQGEPEPIWAFLGSGRLAAPIGAHRPDLVLHGHAHRGSPAGTIGEVPVRNVAIHVTGEDFSRFELLSYVPRMARRLLALLVASAVLAAGAAARPDRPFEVLGSIGASGSTGGGLHHDGVGIRFVEHGSFWIETLIRNTSGETITVLDVRTPEPPRSIVHQVGTRIGLTPECTSPGIPCEITPRDIDEHPLRPVEVPPDGELGVRLHYRLGACADVARSTFASADTFVVDYRESGGIAQQAFALGRLSLQLGRPKGVDCVPRPFSHIGLVGSFTTNPGHLPVPGSDGDTCVRDASGALHYTSRIFNSREEISWRVEIVFPRFAGKGTYKTSGRVERKGPVDVIVSGSFGDGPGWSVFHGHPGVVTVTQAAGSLYGGQLNATLSGRRRFFSAYGSWRCTTKTKAS